MSLSEVEKVANAVLYEGYLLYPYRSSAVKNRQRFNFGVVYPQTYSQINGGASQINGGAEPWLMVTQCLALGGPQAALSVKVRCLRLVERRVGYGNEQTFVPARSIESGGRSYESWQEAAECEFSLPVSHFAELEAAPAGHRYSLPATRTVEILRGEVGMVAGLIVRTQEPLEVWIEARIEQPQNGLYRITVRIENQTPYAEIQSTGREGVLAGSLLSAHTILGVQEGEFVSLLDPPRQYAKAAADCSNAGTWPVLAGEGRQRNTMLSSPIILYDYPKIAAESPGDLFDGAEIDEILSLRILTLTDEEKSAMRRSDDRARQILERTEALPPEHFMKMHGVLRNLDPKEETT